MAGAICPTVAKMPRVRAPQGASWQPLPMTNSLAIPYELAETLAEGPLFIYPLFEELKTGVRQESCDFFRRLFMARLCEQGLSAGEAYGQGRVSDRDYLILRCLEVHLDAALSGTVSRDVAKVIAAEPITAVRKSVTIDWAVRDGTSAKIKVLVQRILKKHGYPPELQEEATKTVLAQAELLCADWFS